MPQSLILSPTADPKRFRAPTGQILTPPADWDRLPPGDAGLTRRVKLAGPSWQVVEKRGNKTFSRGLWAPAVNIAAAQAALEQERSTPEYAKRRQADLRRREREQQVYVGEFALAVLQFLNFAPPYRRLALKLAEAVAAHATPVGSGTVARTERIPVEERAEAAVIAWMRHQTTAYDELKIARVKGLRHEVRRELAEISRELLDGHRDGVIHTAGECPLCRAMGM
ncbi:MAG TPA: DUF2293 domain-containing protein [Planctomycetota bacterium]|jgi:hypothetical protein